LKKCLHRHEIFGIIALQAKTRSFKEPVS